MSNAPKTGRRERLLGRKRPSIDYQLPITDAAAAVAELEAAKAAFDSAQFRADDSAGQAAADAQGRLEVARAAVQDCYEPVTLTAMPPAEFEALVAKPEHAPREGKEEKWNTETFPRSCFLACVDTGDLSVDEWAEFVDSGLSQGEREALYLTAVAINARWPSGSIPNV
jgi:hypothetical protein